MLLLVSAPWVWATTGQEPHPPTSLEIPFLEREAQGARWIAMGGAGMAAVDDGSSMAINPAGLGRIRRIEVLGTIQKQSLDVEATWFGTKATRSLSSTALKELTFSFPFPTYRGSLVMTGSVFRRNVIDAYTVRRGTDPDGNVPNRDSEERRGLVTAWSGGMALQVSPEAFVGFEAHGFTGDFKETDRWEAWGICSDAEFAWDTDVGGYGASMGVQYEPIPLVELGAVLKTPQRITLKGDITQPDGGDPAPCAQRLYSIDDVATLPYSMGFGVAFAPSTFLVTFDLTYTDWHELKYPGPTRDLATDEYVYDPTTDIRLGVEYGLVNLPLRFRAGYARVPLELNWFETKKNRTSVSLGVGAVVQSALTFDVAWQRTSFERESRADSYSEERTNNRLLLTLAYRF
jgi:hypothetical protein